MARLIKIAYAGFTVGLGGDASVTLTDKYRAAYGYTEFSLTFEAVIRSATRATFLAAEAAFVAAFRKPDQDLDVDLGGTNRHTFATADGSGFNARATCEKLGGEEDTANSARYRASVTVQLPADLTGRSGRQTSSVSVEATLSGVRTVTIEGTYTALSTNSAVAQYVSAGTTYCDSVITAIGGTFELLAPVNTGSGFQAAAGFRYDDQNKVLSFRRVYQEVIYRQSVSDTDVAAIKSPSLVVERVTPPDDSDPDFNTRPLEQLRVVYRAAIDKNASVDLAGLYNSTIRPLMLAEANALAGSTVVVTRENQSLEPTANTLSCVLECLADTGAAFYRATLDVIDYVKEPKEWAPVWSGDPYDVDEYDVPGLHLKTFIRQTASRLGATFDHRLMVPTPSGFVLVDQERQESHRSVGVTGDQIPIQEVIHTFRFRRVNVGGSGGAGGGAGGSAGGTQVRTPPPLGFEA
jgi:hypothetical protein